MKTKDIVNWILLIAGAIVLGLILVPYQKSKNTVYTSIPDSCKIPYIVADTIYIEVQTYILPRDD